MPFTRWGRRPDRVADMRPTGYLRRSAGVKRKAFRSDREPPQRATARFGDDQIRSEEAAVGRHAVTTGELLDDLAVGDHVDAVPVGGRDVEPIVDVDTEAVGKVTLR